MKSQAFLATLLLVLALFFTTGVEAKGGGRGGAGSKGGSAGSRAGSGGVYVGGKSREQHYCTEACNQKELGDGVCNSECLTSGCNYDYGDCCNITGCIIGDGICQSECRVPHCLFDYGDCDISGADLQVRKEVLPYCYLKTEGKCTFGLLTNGECDREECNEYECQLDRCNLFIGLALGLGLGIPCCCIVCIFCLSAKGDD